MGSFNAGSLPRVMALERHRVVVVQGEDEEVSSLLSGLTDEFEIVVQLLAETTLQSIARLNPDVVLLPAEKEGWEPCRRIKEGPLGAFTQVIVVGKDPAALGNLTKGEVQADDFVATPVSCEYFGLKLKAQIRLQERLRVAVERAWALNAEIQRVNRDLELLVETRSQELLEVRDLAIFTLAKLAESRDLGTGEHLERMRWYSRIIAEELSASTSLGEEIPRHFVDEIFRSAPLHDIGKVGIPDSILLKPGPLTPQEVEVMKQHTVIGYQGLQEALQKNPAGSFLARAAEIARYHHERFDGRGYPDGLAGKAIPLAARVVAVADVFDALTSPRIYKKALDSDAARKIILREAGAQFDPAIVAAFNRRWKDIYAIGEPYWRAIPEEKLERSFAEYKSVPAEKSTTLGVALMEGATPC